MVSVGCSPCSIRTCHPSLMYSLSMLSGMDWLMRYSSCATSVAKADNINRVINAAFFISDLILGLMI